MLSYQHGYHAGNFADVHKHVALCLLLDHLNAKPAPYCVIDTHAGRGVYDLAGEQAAKTGEWRQGVGRVMTAGTASDGLALYRAAVAAANGGGALSRYPGSPAIAWGAARPGDRAVLLELHPAELAALKTAARGRPGIQVHRRDAFEGLPALLPPAERRGLVLVDPSYEMKAEYETVPALLARARARWPTGIFAIWYPLLAEARHAALRAALRQAAAGAVLISELAGRPAGRGMHGSGLAVVNPPWRFAERLAAAGDELASLGIPAAGAKHRLAAPAPMPSP